MTLNESDQIVADRQVIYLRPVVEEVFRSCTSVKVLVPLQENVP